MNAIRPAAPEASTPGSGQDQESGNGSDQTLGTEGGDSFATLAAALNSLRDAVRSLEVTIRAQPPVGAGSPSAPATRAKPAAVAVAERAKALSDADEWLLERALKDPQGKFARLYRGEWRELGYKERTHAEMALLCKLAWTAKGDAGQMGRIFRTSRLMGPRFDQDGAEMIEKAIEFARERAPERFDEAS
jgi:hypothetical protein